jgi:hypothetical protein
MVCPTDLARNVRTLGAICATAVTLVLWAPPAEAHITRIVITRIESPTFEGVSFGQVGPYEKVRLRAFGEVDPNDPRNSVIADIGLAPRNARGMVEYAMDVVILKPVTLANGNHRLLYYLNNRGNLDSLLFPSMGVLSVFNDGGPRGQWLSHAPGVHDRLQRLGPWRGGRRQSPDDHGPSCDQCGWLAGRRPVTRRIRHRQPHHDHGSADVSSSGDG